MHLDESAQASAPEIATIDLTQEAPAQRREKIISVCVHAVLATPAGVHVDAEKLHGLIDQRFDQLFDGDRFDFQPVLRSLLKIDGVQAEELYVGIVNLIAVFDRLGVRMEEPSIELDAKTKQHLLDEARTASATARSSFERRQLRARVEELERAKLGELMVARELITELELDAALQAQRDYGGRLGTNLVQMGLVNPAQLSAFLGEQLGLPSVTSVGAIEPAVLELLPAELAARHRVVPMRVVQDRLEVAMADPSDLEAIERIERETGLSVRPSVAPELVIIYALARHYDVRQPTQARAAPHRRLVAREPHFSYTMEDLAADYARADDLYDVLAMLQRFLAERYVVSSVFDVADEVVRGFAASGIDGDPIRIRDRFVHFGTGPSVSWFEEVLGLREGVAELNVVIYAGDAPAAIAIGAGPREGARVEGEALDAMRTLTSAAIRMVDLRAEILSAATPRRG